MAEHRSYKPADVNEWRQFASAWCKNCRQPQVSVCATFYFAAALDAADAEYPRAFRFGEDGPECANFEPAIRRAG